MRALFYDGAILTGAAARLQVDWVDISATKVSKIRKE
jgi:hypothetical protein